MDFDGQTTLYVSDEDAGKMVREEPYNGKLVVTMHAVKLNQDPSWQDWIARELDRFMREHHLSRLEAYWNAVPPLEGRDGRRSDSDHDERNLHDGTEATYQEAESPDGP